MAEYKLINGWFVWKRAFIVCLLCLSQMSIAGTPIGDTPAVGALVRVIAPTLGSHWRLGVFNRLRVEPRCHRVVIFQINDVGAQDILPLNKIERLQRHTIYDGEVRSAPNPSAMQQWNDAEWVEVPIQPLRDQNKRLCPENS